MHLIPPIYSHNQRHVRQEYKDALRLAEGRLNECEVKKMHRLEKHFSTLMREKSLPLRWMRGRRGMKGVQSIIGAAVIEGCHYNIGAIPLQPLKRITAVSWIQIEKGKRWPVWVNGSGFEFTPNEYLNVAAPLKGWSKIILWRIKGGRDIFCFGHRARARPTLRHFTPHCLCSISQVLWCCAENWKWLLMLLVSRLSPLDGITCNKPVI